MQDFVTALYQRMPVSELRLRFSDTVLYTSIPFYALTQPDITQEYREWFMGVMKWLFDEKYQQWVLLRPYNGRLLIIDWICENRGYLPAVEALDFAITLRAVTTKGWDRCLRVCASGPAHFSVPLCKRLLDVGACPTFLTDSTDIYQQIVRELYNTRQQCKKSVIAFIRLYRVSPFLKRWAQHDVVKLIGKIMWARRFEVQCGSAKRVQRRKWK